MKFLTIDDSFSDTGISDSLLVSDNLFASPLTLVVHDFYQLIYPIHGSC